MKEPVIHAPMPDQWPTQDEFPETDISDLVRKFEENVVPED